MLLTAPLDDQMTMDGNDALSAAPSFKRIRSDDDPQSPSLKRARTDSVFEMAHGIVEHPPPFERDAAKTAELPSSPVQHTTVAQSPQVDSRLQPSERSLEVEDVSRISTIPFDDMQQLDADSSDTLLETSMDVAGEDVQTGSATTTGQVARQLSPAGLQQSTSARGSPLVFRLTPRTGQRAERIAATRPMPQPELTAATSPDALFVQEMIAQLERVSKWKSKVWYKEQARRILEVLALARESDASEALFLSTEDARKHLDSDSFFPGPIFVDGAQPMELCTINDFLGEYYDNNAKVSIQDPSVALSKDRAYVRETTIGQLKERFGQGRPKIPWNCLELACHVEDGIRPSFLNNEDCRLITKLKVPTSDDHTSRRGFEPNYKEIEKWALLAQAGSLTPPHQDSHGYSTYITVQTGLVGFGWLANPTPAQHAAWLASPSTFVSGPWRYKILHPGTTVYFPTGTVHFVFRLASAGDTLAFGGHVLRCSRIVSWVRTLIEERAHRAVTNEDLSVSAPAYLERVAKFVKQARRIGQEGKWGGREAVAEFLRLKDKFMEMN